ncbi:MAG: Lrp/AsnC family transcriptional regulator [Aquificaceae bacterium]
MKKEINNLLSALQREIPLVSRPFLEIGKSVGMEEDEVIKAIESLKREKVIRQVSPIYDTRMLGYDSALVAFKVKPERIEEVASFVNTHPGVSHNYQRTHEFNLWFTIAVPLDYKRGLEDTIKLMVQNVEVSQYVILRSVRVFKIGVKLDYESVDEREEVSRKEFLYKPLTEEEKLLVKITQEDMPLVYKPFLEYAKSINVEESYLLEKLREFKDRNILRRVSAILHHRKVGFTFNSMSVWRVDSQRVEEVGSYIAGFKGVSHCYERTGGNEWPYNLFAMIHGRSEEEVRALAKRISEETGIQDYALLFSVKEFKKRRVKYFSEDFQNWYECGGKG